ncbi:hypothetical protein B0H14DRAFT_3509663 [Mycena olivaceomarginata]|nr:hypothetical protein B0H14DRAFT_3509663 [Mycena olivaceomarginata]
MDLAQRSLVKYQREFRASTRDEMPTSPVSTAPEVYNAFPEDGFPYPRTSITSMRTFRTSKAFGRATTSRGREAGGGAPFDLLLYGGWDEGDLTFLRVRIHKSDQSRRLGGRKPAPSAPSKKNPKSKAEDPQARLAPNAPITGLLSPDTQFKKTRRRAHSVIPARCTFASAIPGQGLPNPLKGMASSSQLKYDAVHANKSARSIIPPVVNATEEATFHQAYLDMRRDPPPHLPPSHPAAIPLEEEEKRTGAYPNRPPAGAPNQDAGGHQSGGRQGAGAGGDGDPPDDDDGNRNGLPWDNPRGLADRLLGEGKSGRAAG